MASATAEGCHETCGQPEILTSWSQKCSTQVGIRERGDFSDRDTEHKHYSVVRFDQHYPSTGIQSSVTKFRFENHIALEACEEWYYVVHYLKSVVTNIEGSLNDFGISYDIEAHDLNWYARPYHYTADDIVDIRRLQSPDEGISSVSSLSKTCDHLSQKYGEISNAVMDVSTNRFQPACVSNQCSSLDKYLASTALAVCNLVQRRCDCGISADLQQHGGPAELLPYLDAKTFCGGLLTGLELPQSSYVLRCDNISRQLVLDSFGLLHLERLRDPLLFSAPTSTSSLTPDGDGDKQKLPNIDQLRAIQDNLAYNVRPTFSIAIIICKLNSKSPH